MQGNYHCDYAHRLFCPDDGGIKLIAPDIYDPMTISACANAKSGESCIHRFFCGHLSLVKVKNGADSFEELGALPLSLIMHAVAKGSKCLFIFFLELN